MKRSEDTGGFFIDESQEAFGHLRTLAETLGLRVEPPHYQERGFEMFVVLVGPRDHPWWDVITVRRGMDNLSFDTILITYESINAKKEKPVTPQRATRLMGKAAKKQGLASSVTKPRSTSERDGKASR